jgi:uncharacterized protein YceH (UPF0502 family)
MPEEINTLIPPVLTPLEARVLACLFEKSVATPEYYPMTLVALTAACNQKSNRDPVLQSHEIEIVTALDGLRDKKLAWTVSLAGSRVPKYRHSFPEVYPLPLPALALLCELILRGPQTAAELRAHASRLVPFEDANQVQALLESLLAYEPGPLVIRLPRQPGRREERFAHLICGPVSIEEAQPAPEPARLAVQAENERIAHLESEVRALTDEVNRLKAQFQDFISQFK